MITESQIHEVGMVAAKAAADIYGDVGRAYISATKPLQDAYDAYVKDRDERHQAYMLANFKKAEV